MEFPFESDRAGCLYLLGDCDRRYILPTSDPDEAQGHLDAGMVLLRKLPLEGLTFDEVERVSDEIWEKWQEEKALNRRPGSIKRWIQKLITRLRAKQS